MAIVDQVLAGKATFSDNMRFTHEQAVRMPSRKMANHEIAATLTDRQIEVLGFIAAGLSNKAIARELVLSGHTVKIHVAAILRTLDVRNRTQAALKAQSIGIPPQTSQIREGAC